MGRVWNFSHCVTQFTFHMSGEASFVGDLSATVASIKPWQVKVQLSEVWEWPAKRNHRQEGGDEY